ncbi:N-acetylmuramoyl-L-alanine amidase [Prevotella pectinovora]|uniref:N-acetylmuramoyl-L-alanine amidase n=1 Tax=Prevotella pectinovora TaxID=1602169 RepID=UPI0005B6D9B8|nr:N-acetylmuramoyl-L-alanine amidase [Prevotella pectinovora]KIP58453.1 N-acetylmuramoyl-L-alanine amidase [Prevotella pectinovora]MCI6047022.1 N-acetylmuramoyl-L-alanine amidase [Prevotella pectinovora]
MRNIKRIFIHCTASSRKTSIEQLLAEFKSRGWHAPGYHYVAMPDGMMVKLLDEEKVSNGVRGYNQSAINIAYVGGIDAKGSPTDNRTIEQKAAIVHLLIELRSRYPNALIMGHRDIWGANNPKAWQKACPCFNATREYGAI